MKKYSILLGAAFGLFALASCQKEVDVNIPESENANKHIPFVLKADVPETRTTLDASTWEMAWEDGDVIYAVTTDEEWGQEWVSAEQSYIETIAEFTYDGEGFSTTKEISEGTHTFNFLYTGGTQKSYHRGAGSTFQLYQNQEMDAQAPTANLKVYDALAGQVTAKTPTTFVNVSMAHLFTLMKVTLKNKTGADITANKFEISAEGANLYGVFNITFGNAPAAAFNKNGGNQINVTITNGTIANGEDLDVFFVMAPLNEYSGDITFKVIDSNGNTYTKKNTVAGVTFSAGKYNTASYTLKTADPLECVNLDWTYPTGGAAATSAGIQAQPGVTADGLGSDYDSSNHFPYCIKFDNTGDFIQIHTDNAIGQVSVDYKMIGGNNTSTLQIYESTGGTEWNQVEVLTISGKQNSTGELTTTSLFSPASRFVKIVFNKGSNVGIGGISITKGNTDPYIYAEDVTVPAKGVESGIATYEARNFEDDVIVPEPNGVTGCVTDALALDGEIIFSVDPNYTTSPVAGTIVLCSQSHPSVTKTINVTQAASVFEASSTDAMAFAWDDKTNSEEKTVTITSTFALTKTDNVVLSGTNADKFSVSLTPVSNSTDEYTLSVSVIEDNESEADYEAVVTISRNNLAIAINLSQAKSSGGEKINQVLFHETFGNNPNKARDWDDSYSVKSGVSAIYSGITSYDVTNVKQGKNTTGSTDSGLNQSSQETDAVIVIGPLAVADCEDMVLTYQWKAASISKTYYTKLYYATSASGTYSEVTGTGNGATSFVERKYILPEAAQVNTLYLKIVWRTSNTQGIIDEVNLEGKY